MILFQSHHGGGVADPPHLGPGQWSSLPSASFAPLEGSQQRSLDKGPKTATSGSCSGALECRFCGVQPSSRACFAHSVQWTWPPSIARRRKPGLTRASGAAGRYCALCKSWLSPHICDYHVMCYFHFYSSLFRVIGKSRRWRIVVHYTRSCLRSCRRSPQRISAEEDALVAGAMDDPTVPLEELEEVRLLEGALARALRIRGALGAHKCTAAAGPEGRDGNRTTSTNHLIGSLAPKSTSKPLANYREAQKLPASQHRGGLRGSCAAAGGRAPARPGPAAQTRVRTPHSLRKVKHPPTATGLGCERRAEPVSRPPEKKGTAVTSKKRRGGGCVTVTEQTGAGDVAAGDAADDGTPSEFLSAWRTQSARRDRLWDKILTRVSHPLNERTEFIERLRGTFPACWPHGGPADAQAEVGQLILQCRALTHCYQTELQAARPGGPPDASGKASYESLLTLQGLGEMVGDLLHRAEQLKTDADVWERLWSRDPAGCFLKSRWSWKAPPTTLTYSSQTELGVLEGLRLRVALLQQEIHLQLVLSEALGFRSSPPLSHEGRPSPSVLRGLYALLAEGGLRFPALVLDTEPD